MTVTAPTGTDPDVLARDLGALVDGTVLVPADAGFEALTTPFNLAATSAPAAAIEVSGPQDVAAVMRFAGARGYDVVVQATGHGAVRRTRPTLLVSTRRLDSIEIGPDSVARIGAGVRWRELLDEAAPLGLGAPCGSAPAVGVVGYVTGGGSGPVSRSHGFASDSAVAFELVTGEGRIVRATASENEDLFWALRGGKGAAGIVTAVELQLFATGDLYGGAYFFGPEDVSRVAAAWLDWAGDLDARGTTSIALMRLPAMPGVPEQIAGWCVLAVRFGWTGDPVDGEAEFSRIAETAPVILGGAGVMPFAAIGAIHGDPTDPMPVSEAAVLLDRIDQEAVEALLRAAGPDAESLQLMVELRLHGGRLADDVDSVLSHRDAAANLFLVGLGVPELVAATEADSARILHALGPWTSGASLPNFGASSSLAAIRSRYTPEKLARLAAVVGSHDPLGVLPEARAVRAAAKS